MYKKKYDQSKVVWIEKKELNWKERIELKRNNWIEKITVIKTKQKQKQKQYSWSDIVIMGNVRIEAQNWESNLQIEPIEIGVCKKKKKTELNCWQLQLKLFGKLYTL